MTIQEVIKSKLSIVLLAAFIIRIVLVTLTSQSLYEHNDSYLHRDWGRVAFLFGPSETYQKEHISNVGIVNNLPPGATYLFGGMYYFHVQASKVVNIILQREPGQVLWMNDGTFANMFLRLPAVFADLVIGVVIYLMVAKEKKENSLLAASLYVFNPASIYNSAVWGQIDTVPLMFFMAALLVLTQKKYFLSMLFVVASLFIKLSLLPLIPMYGLLLLIRVPFQKIVLYSLIILGVVLVAILPISSQSHIWLLEFLSKNSTNVLDNITANAYNFWWLVIAPKLLVPAVTVGEKFLFLTLSQWGYLLYTIFMIPLAWLIWMKRHSKELSAEFLTGIFSVVAIIYFLFLPSMHERYLITLFPLMAAYVGFKKEYLKLFLLLSVVYTTNIVSVWQYRVPEAEIRSNPILTNQIFSWVLSVIVTMSGLYFYSRFIKESLSKYNKRKEHSST
ncbi:hypothetical protein IPM65_00555 [Candidatus Roizmanbacteria bacterium]|nr:MAG: hypothetical protein IPM65_00555 [Candidatus Roizmanbacteria bacterium]